MMKIKNQIANILTKNVFGLMIKQWYNGVIPFYDTKIDVNRDSIELSVVAQLFWKIYESAEVRFIKKYLEKNKTIIELGSSIGAVSSIIGVSKNQETALYCFEANPNLISSIHKNLEINHVSQFFIYNGAIAPKGRDSIYFHIGETNLTSKISLEDEGVNVPAINISDFIDNHNISNCNLVSDIEGAEIFLLSEQPEVFKKSSTIIIELHSCEYNGSQYTVDQLNEKILEIEGISLVDRYGSVFVYSNRIA